MSDDWTTAIKVLILKAFLTLCFFDSLVWLQQLFNNCLALMRILKIWLRSRVVALLKPGKELTPKEHRPISLLSHTFKLIKWLSLNRLTSFVEEYFIEHQAEFCPGKFTTAQLFNLTQHIEDRFQKNKITGAVFVDLNAHTIR